MEATPLRDSRAASPGRASPLALASAHAPGGPFLLLRPSHLALADVLVLGHAVSTRSSKWSACETLPRCMACLERTRTRRAAAACTPAAPERATRVSCVHRNAQPTPCSQELPTVVRSRSYAAVETPGRPGRARGHRPAWDHRAGRALRTASPRTARTPGRRHLSLPTASPQFSRAAARPFTRVNAPPRHPQTRQRPACSSTKTRLTAANVSEQRMMPFTVSFPSRARPMNAWYS